MECTIQYDDKEFANSSELLSYAKENNKLDIIAALEPVEREQMDNQFIFLAQKLDMQPQAKSEGNIGVSMLERAEELQKENYTKLLDNLSTKFGINWQTDNSMSQLGRYENGVVYINMKKIRPDTPFHEFLHPFEQTIKRKNPILWKSLAARAEKITYKGDFISAFVKRNYPELEGEDLSSETIVTALGLAASDSNNIANDSAFNSFKERMLDFIKKIVEYINSFISTPSRNISANDVSLNMSFRQITDLVFGGQNKIELDQDAIKTSDVFYQKGDEAFQKIADDQTKIKLDEPTHKYSYEGKEIRTSVNEEYVKPFYNKIFKDDTRTDLQKQIDDIKKENGTHLHKVFESVLQRYIDPATGLKRKSPLAHPTNVSSTDYTAIEKYLSDRLAQYDDETRFISEARIYDAKKSVAGSIDFLVIKSDGTGEILDWKSIQSKYKGERDEDLAWYKEEAYQIQLGAYKDILEKNYGIKITYAAAIPIQADTKIIIDKTTNSVKGQNRNAIRFGDLNPRNVEQKDNFLLPVILKDQTTGDEEIDRLVSKLRGVYEQMRNQRLTDSGDKKFERDEKLRSTSKAIKDIQVRKDVFSLVDNGNLIIKNINKQIKAGNLNESQILDNEDTLKVYADLSSYFAEALATDDYFTDDKRNDLLRVEGNAKFLLKKMQQERAKLAQELANPIGIVDITKAERRLDVLKRTFRSISTLPNATIKVFWNLISKQQHKRDVKTLKLIGEGGTFDKIRTDLLKWADARNISHTDVFDRILAKDNKGRKTGKLISKYSREYNTTLTNARTKKDVDWMVDNIKFDVDAYKASYKKYEEYVNKTEYSINPEVNKKLRMDRMAQYAKDYNPIDAEGNLSNETALFSKSNYFIKPKEKWLSSEWKELQKDENKPLLAAYNEFQNVLDYSYKIGMLDAKTHTFIPNIVSSKLDSIAFGNTKNLINIGNAFDKSIVNTETGFGELDPITGKPKYVVPVFFTNDLGEKKTDADGSEYRDYSNKSFDLFRVFSVWGAHMYNYEAMKEIEDKARVLQRVEENKKSLVTNAFGKVKKDVNGKVVDQEGNKDNTQVFENLMNFYLYGQDADADTDFSFEFKGKEYSGKKAVKALVQYMSVKTLSLNAISASSNLFGGSANAFFEASKRRHFNEKDWTKGGYLLATRDAKALAMLGRFNIFLEDLNHERANHLSVSSLVSNVTADKLFFLQKGSDKAVQYPVFLATSLNYMLDENNKIVSIKDHVRKLNNYDRVYDRLSLSEKKALDGKINTEIENLKSTKSLYNIAKIENDQLVIPGLDLDGEEAGRFRLLVKKLNKGILGNSTRDDITNARLTLYGQLGLQFRNWMPQMITERFGDMSYDNDLGEFKYGKARLFIKNFISPRVLSLTKELITGFGTDTISRAKERYAELLQRAIESGDISNESEFVSETEFIDQYISSLRSSMRELLVWIAISGLVLVAAPGKDDDKDKKGYKQVMMKAFLKYQDEIGFYYSPQSATDLLKTPVPVVGLLTDFQRFFTNSIGEGVGAITGDEERQKNNRPLKYGAKLFPVAKEAVTWYAAMDDDFRKEHDIKLK